MQIFRKIVRASFEIVSDSGHLPGVYFHQVGAGPYPRLRAKSPSKRRGHLAATALQSAGKAYLAYVVEGHASACPQTVGVDVGMWRCYTNHRVMT